MLSTNRKVAVYPAFQKALLFLSSRLLCLGNLCRRCGQMTGVGKIGRGVTKRQDKKISLKKWGVMKSKVVVQLSFQIQKV
jgi:hypothetical protein